MKLKPFKLERYFSKYEFNVQHLMSCSDCEPLSIKDLLENADDECVNMWENLYLSYTESKGHPVLLDEIAKLYDGINPEDIIEIVPEEGIYIAMRSLIEDGDHVVCVNPCYQSLQEVAKAQGARLKLWEAKYDNGWKFDIDELRSLVTNKTKMIVINFPHNPTGAMPTIDEFHEIINIAKKNDCIIFSDEMYRYLEYDEADRLPSACEVYDKAISLFGMSKTFSMPGLRMGWLVTKNADFMAEFMTYKDYTTICQNACSQVLSIMALRQKDGIIKRNLDIIKSNLDAFDSVVQKHSNIISYTKPIAGSVTMPMMDESIPTYQLSQDLIKERNLMILPDLTYDIDDNGFRLGLGREDFRYVLGIFDEYLSNKY